jgi:uncharacterized peroxidase-related enzyme
MAYIRHIPPASADGRLAQVYREIRLEIPRVPTLMQVFSLRPETLMGVYRSWLSMMWAGAVPRQSKELAAVVVSKAARCRYCLDAHMVFLLAAGMSEADGYDVERRLGEAECLDDRDRILVQFASKISSDPRSLTTADRLLLAKEWPDREERVELLATIAAFNGVVRIANALGVPPEIPNLIGRFERGRRGVLLMLSRLTALSVDLNTRALPARPPEENREHLEELFLGRLGFASLPPGFDQLEHCPELLDGQLQAMDAGISVIPRDRWMRIGLVVGRLSGCDYFSTATAEWLAQRGESPADVVAASEGSPSSLSDQESAALRFVRDLTLHSHTLVQERVSELRALGMSDGAVLDLTYVASMFNSMTRLVLALSPA